MIATDTDTLRITEIINLYFKGSYYGNIEQLKQAFHPEAHVTGSLNGKICDWTCTEFMERVTTMPTSANKGEKYDKEILLIDKTNDAAMVKARVTVGDLIFTDYITLLKINDQWMIRNKIFTS